jgi:hypothetical protein
MMGADRQVRDARGQMQRRLRIAGAIALSLAAIHPLLALSQEPAQTAAPIAAAPVSNTTAATGGTLHGVIKSGNIPLPGVAVTATNTLTGKRYATTTDITGAWSMTIPQNGRYVIRTEFAAFAASTHEALLNANSHDQTVNFDLTLASRAAQQAREPRCTGAGAADSAGHAAAGREWDAEPEPDEFAGCGDGCGRGWERRRSGAALPGAATSSTFSSDSVAVTGSRDGESAGRYGYGPDSRCD